MKPDPSFCKDRDRLGAVLKEGMEDAMGCAAAQAVFTHAGLPSIQSAVLQSVDLPPLLGAMQALFGLRAGRGMAVCTGRVCFKYGLKAFGEELGWFEPHFRLLPPTARIRAGLDVLARAFHPVTATDIRIDQDKYHTYWIMAPGLAAQTGAPPTPACHLATGVLQEFLYWAGGGKFYLIEEKTCILNGAAACSLAIDKHPID